MGKSIPRKGRQLLINGLLLSKIIYTIPIYGGLPKTHSKKIQVILNNAARYIWNKNKRKSTLYLMRKCNWLTFTELVSYHSLINLWKIIKLGKPQHMSERIHILDNNYLRSQIPRINLVADNCRWRTIPEWNNLST